MNISNILIIIGTLVMISSVGFYLISKSFLESQIHKNMVIKNDSKVFEYFKEPPTRILRKFYFFDVQNPDEINNGKKPRVLEKGPFTYREVWEKKNIKFLGENLVQFDPVITTYFEPSLSAGNESDLITFLNVPAIGMIEKNSKENINEFTLMGMEGALSFMGIGLFVKKTVKELIAGYEDPLMKLAKTFDSSVKSNIFSLDHGRNGSIWQNFTIMTGVDKIENIGKINKWNGLEKLTHWDDEYANMINGSDGSFFTPNRKRDEIIYAYNSDMCRSYHLKYLKDNVIDGINTYEFHLAKDIFYDSKSNPDNKPFCGDDCLGNGVFNLSKCTNGISSFISLPHFYNADPKFINSIDGLEPREDKHDFVLNFEPITGVPIDGKIRLQISFFLTNKVFQMVKRVKPVLLPVFWLEASTVLPIKTRDELKTIASYVKFCEKAPIVFFLIGAILVIGSIIYKILLSFFPVLKIKTKNKKQNLKVNGENLKDIKYNEVNTNSTDIKI